MFVMMVKDLADELLKLVDNCHSIIQINGLAQHYVMVEPVAHRLLKVLQNCDAYI